METKEKQETSFTEQQKKDAEAFAKLPELVRALLLERAYGMVQGAEMAADMAG